MTAFLHTTHLPGGATDYLVPDTAEGRSFARATPPRFWYQRLSPGDTFEAAMIALGALECVIWAVAPIGYAWILVPAATMILPRFALLPALKRLIGRSIRRRQHQVDGAHPTVYRVPPSSEDGVMARLPRTINGLETLELLWEAGQVDDDVFAATLTRLQQEARRAELDARHEQWMQYKAREAREHQQRKRQVDELIERHQRDQA